MLVGLNHNFSLSMQQSKYLITFATGLLQKWMQTLLCGNFYIKALFHLVFRRGSQKLMNQMSEMQSSLIDYKEHVPKRP